MTRSWSVQEIRPEARLLFALLDATDCEGLISGTFFQSRWQTLKMRVDSGASYEGESEEFYELMVEIENSGALSGSWIEGRWLAVKARIRGGS